MKYFEFSFLSRNLNTCALLLYNLLIIIFTVDIKALSDYFGMIDLVNLGMPEAACKLHTNIFLFNIHYFVNT